uniref:Uncharacterized protein n=1 Tax=Bombyx mori TaxID=7091 RepID=A0A8R2M1G8_BOMMO|nr:uncharacterized protein LOC105842934 isoform X2 [Bombyx mori]
MPAITTTIVPKEPLSSGLVVASEDQGYGPGNSCSNNRFTTSRLNAKSIAFTEFSIPERTNTCFRSCSG